MFAVEILIDTLWTLASSHTLLVDAEAQKQRFIESDVSPDTLRIVER
jgi:hypothetical protein